MLTFNLARINAQVKNRSTWILCTSKLFTSLWQIFILFNLTLFCVRYPTAQSVSQSVRCQSLNLSLGALMLPDVHFSVHCRIFRCTAGNFMSTAYNVGSIYFKRKSKKLNSATFICHLQFVTFTSVLWLIKHSRFAKQ